MKLLQGKKVKFLNDIGGGTFVSMIDKNTALILRDDDFEIPVPINELVFADDSDNVLYFSEQDEKASEKADTVSHQTEEKNVAESEQEEEEYDKSIKTEKKDLRIFLSFVPANVEMISDSDLKAYLVNDSDYYLLYNVMVQFSQYTAHIDGGVIEPDNIIHLITFRREDLNEVSGFVVQAMFYKKGIHEPVEPINMKKRIRPLLFYLENNFLENQYFEEKAVMLEVLNEEKVQTDEKAQDNQEMKKEKIRQMMNERQEKAFTTSSEKMKQVATPNPVEEIDLHINCLVNDYKGLTNSEMLYIQLNHFRRSLENAMIRNVNKIVFIHGVGNGTLKMELRKILEKDYQHLAYQDASFREYGFGATMVLIK